MGLLQKKFAAANINMVAVKQVLTFKENISYDGEHSLYKNFTNQCGYEWSSAWLHKKKKSTLFINMFKWCYF